MRRPIQFEKRLEQLGEDILSESFIQGRGLGNEVPFWIFDYPPEKELLMRNVIKRLIRTCKSDGLDIVEIDLYELCQKIFDNKGYGKKMIALEKRKGSKELFDKLKLMLKPATIRDEIRSDLDSVEHDLIFITGVGKVWPLLRAHTVLNNLQTVVQDKTLIMFYPGKYSGKDLSFLGKFKDGNYYRAFRLVPEEKEGEGI